MTNAAAHFSILALPMPSIFASAAWVATSRIPYAPNGAPVEIVEPPVAAEAQDSESGAKTGGS